MLKLGCHLVPLLEVVKPIGIEVMSHFNNNEFLQFLKRNQIILLRIKLPKTWYLAFKFCISVWFFFIFLTPHWHFHFVHLSFSQFLSSLCLIVYNALYILKMADSVSLSNNLNIQVSWELFLENILRMGHSLNILQCFCWAPDVMKILLII